MKANISWNGDESVGIFGGSCEMDIPIEFEDQQDRDWWRKEISNLYNAMIDDKCKVLFEDELTVIKNIGVEILMTNERKLYNLKEALIDNLINTPDDEFIKECEEDGIDIGKEANKVREIMKKAYEISNKQ